jgi:glutamate carboxypeptidase
MSSYSHDKNGVTRVLKHYQRALENLGLTTKFFKGDQRDLAPLLVAEKSGSENKWITLICHADTVHQKTDMKNKMVMENEHIASGPGVIDNKGGMVVIERALSSYLEGLGSQVPRYGLRVICSPSEEIGSPGLHHIFHYYGKRAHAVLGFEPASPEGNIIGSRQGNRWYNLEINGLSAHAGRDHARGINAGVELAQKIVKLQEITNYKAGVTLNIGHINAGKARHNIVAEKALALIDVRFQNLKQRQETHEQIVEVFNQKTVFNDKGKTTESQWEIVDDCPPFENGERSMRLFNNYQRSIYIHEGRHIQLQHAGGCADSNHLNTPFVPVLDGLGPVGGEMHTNREWIDLRSIETRSLAAANLIQDLMKD